MAVPLGGDGGVVCLSGAPEPPPTAIADRDPYTGQPWDSPSVSPSGYTPPLGPIDEPAVKQALEAVACRGLLIYGGRYCLACHSDLADLGSPRASSNVGFEKTTGVARDRAPMLQGGHTADCPIPILWVWLTGAESCYTRRRGEETAVT